MYIIDKRDWPLPSKKDYNFTLQPDCDPPNATYMKFNDIFDPSHLNLNSVKTNIHNILVINKTVTETSNNYCTTNS